jgi:aminopeptidase N
MDEGLAQFASAKLLDETYPHRFVAVDRYFGGLVPWPYKDVEWSRSLDGEGLDAYRRAPNWDIPATPTWKYWPPEANRTTYAKTALWLDMLERRIGWPALQKGLASFVAANAYRHPSPDAFFAAISAAAGEDLTPFFDSVYRTAATFDYAVSSVDSHETDSGATDTTELVRRLGDGVFPVNVEVRFDDGSDVVEHWDGKDPWRTFTYRRDAHVRSAEVDPNRLLLLDVNTTNNSWTSAPRAAEAAGRWALRWWLWLQQVSLTYAFVA